MNNIHDIWTYKNESGSGQHIHWKESDSKELIIHINKMYFVSTLYLKESIHFVNWFTWFTKKVQIKRNQT